MNLSSLQAQMDQALAEIGQKQQQMRAVEEQLLSRSATARSKDRMVSATVTAGGELSTLEFHDERYRTMAKAELADIIVKVVGEARAEMLNQVNEALAPQMDGIADLREQLHGGSPWGEFLQPLLKMQQDVTDEMTRQQRDGR